MTALNAVFFNLPAVAAICVAAVILYAARESAIAGARKALIALLCILLLIHLAVFLNTTLAYVVFPYEGKSVVEGPVLYNAWQYLHGQQSYRAPEALPATSQVYPPVYEMALAGILALTGLSLQAGRFFSLLCALGTSFVVGLAVLRMTRRRVPAFFGGLLVLAMYGLTGQWVEQIRCDSLMQFLIALGLYLSWRPASAGKFPVAGLILSLLAVYTKQVAIFVPAAIVLFLWLRSKRTAVIWGVVFLVCALAAFIGMQAWSNGWFAFYVLKIPFSAGVDWGKLAMAASIIGAMWVTFAGIAAALGGWFRSKEQSQSEPQLWLFAFIAAGILCLVQSLKWGAVWNSFMPLVPPLAVLAGVAFSELDSRLSGGTWLRLLVPAAAVMQVALISYQPTLPVKDDAAAQRRIGEWVSAAPGDAFVEVFSSRVFMLGKKYFGDNVTTGDLVRAGAWHGNGIVDMAGKGEFAVMVLRPKIEPPELADAVSRNYKLVERIPMQTPMNRWGYMQVFIPKSEFWQPALELSK